jgi:hypothetical protein
MTAIFWSFIGGSLEINLFPRRFLVIKKKDKYFRGDFINKKKGKYWSRSSANFYIIFYQNKIYFINIINAVYTMNRTQVGIIYFQKGI